MFCVRIECEHRTSNVEEKTRKLPSRRASPGCAIRRYTSQVSTRWLPNINWVRAIVCPAVVFIAMNMDRGYQTDFWHHLARGREIATAGRIPDAETMVFTVAGKSVRDPN